MFCIAPIDAEIIGRKLGELMHHLVARVVYHDEIFAEFLGGQD